MKKQKIGVWDIVIFAVVCIVFLISLHKVITLTLEYRAAWKEYRALEQYVQIIEPSDKNITDTVQDTEEISETAPDKISGITEEICNTEAAQTSEMQQEELVVQYYEGFIDIAVDFDALTAINPDLCGWLYVPAVAVSYPIVLGTDNDYYLTHTFQKTANKSGAIFLDAGTQTPFEEENTVIHGHNMKDGSMFGRLKKLYHDKRVYAGEPYFYIYTKEKTYKYLIFDRYVTANASEAYLISKEAPVVTLSTCYGDVDAAQWLVVQGLLVDEK